MIEIKDLIASADILDIQGKNKEEVIREFVDVLARKPQITDKEDFLRHILDREKIISTGIGIGLAMPHVKIASVTDFALAIGRSRQGIEFDSLDGFPVHIVAMIGASDRQSNEFLRVLARLVLTLKDKALRQKVLEAQSPEQVRQLLLDHVA